MLSFILVPSLHNIPLYVLNQENVGMNHVDCSPGSVFFVGFTQYFLVNFLYSIDLVVCSQDCSNLTNLHSSLQLHETLTVAPVKSFSLVVMCVE